jgi:hypothetical protein
MNFYSNTFSHPFLLYGWLILRTTIFCDHLFAYENVPIALRICRRYQNQHKQLYTSEGVAHIWCLLQTFNRVSKEIAALRYILWHDFCWTICGVPNLSSVRLLVLLVGAWNLIWYHRIRAEVLGSSLGFCSLEKKRIGCPLSVHVWALSSHMWEDVDCPTFFISLDFWFFWLVHET